MKNISNMTLFLLIGVCAVIYFAAENSNREAKLLTEITTVWIPFPPTGQRRPYYDVKIVSQGKEYIKFRTSDGQLIEQHGDYGIEIKPRNSKY